jgi:hypothetical protein
LSGETVSGRLAKRNGEGQKDSRSHSHRSATGVGDFAKLVREAEDRGIKWETRRQLYIRLELPDEERIRIETLVVDHIGNGRVDPKTTAEIVLQNLFPNGTLRY